MGNWILLGVSRNKRGNLEKRWTWSRHNECQERDHGVRTPSMRVQIGESAFRRWSSAVAPTLVALYPVCHAFTTGKIRVSTLFDRKQATSPPSKMLKASKQSPMRMICPLILHVLVFSEFCLEYGSREANDPPGMPRARLVDVSYDTWICLGRATIRNETGEDSYWDAACQDVAAWDGERVEKDLTWAWE